MLRKADLPHAINTALYILMLNPARAWKIGKEIWGEEKFEEFTCHYNWLGAHLAAFFSGSPDPLEELDSSKYEDFKEKIRLRAHCYIQLWVLIFQGESYIKKEFKERGFPMPADRSKILQMLYAEEVFNLIIRFIGEYETLSKNQKDERVRTASEALNGEITDEMFKIVAERWAKEDKKLLRDNPFLPKASQWSKVQIITEICLDALHKHKEKLPAFSSWVEANKNLQLKYGDEKMLFTHGDILKYPGRGKGKKKRS